LNRELQWRCVLIDRASEPFAGEASMCPAPMRINFLLPPSPPGDPVAPEHPVNDALRAKSCRRPHVPPRLRTGWPHVAHSLEVRGGCGPRWMERGARRRGSASGGREGRRLSWGRRQRCFGSSEYLASRRGGHGTAGCEVGTGLPAVRWLGPPGGQGHHHIEGTGARRRPYARGQGWRRRTWRSVRCGGAEAVWGISGGVVRRCGWWVSPVGENMAD
jgi:hypothetical protein